MAVRKDCGLKNPDSHTELGVLKSRIAKKRGEILKPHEDALLVNLAVEGKTKRVEEGKDHHGRVNKDRWGQEHDDMPAEARPAHKKLRSNAPGRQ